MGLANSDQSTAVWVRYGDTIRPLTLGRQAQNDAAVLVDAAGTVIDPQTVVLLRWPTGAEASLRRGGYPIGPYPDPAEPWCNCAD